VHWYRLLIVQLSFLAVLLQAANFCDTVSNRKYFVDFSQDFFCHYMIYIKSFCLVLILPFLIETFQKVLIYFKTFDCWADFLQGRSI